MAFGDPPRRLTLCEAVGGDLCSIVSDRERVDFDGSAAVRSAVAGENSHRAKLRNRRARGSDVCAWLRMRSLMRPIKWSALSMSASSVPPNGGNSLGMAGIARGDRERPVSGLVRATDGAVARRPAEMANAHGDAANPVGALENPPEQAGLGVLQVAAQGVGAEVRDLDHAGQTAAPGWMERERKSAWALEPWAPKDKPLGDSPQTHRKI